MFDLKVEELQNAIEEELKTAIGYSLDPSLEPYYSMLSYQMGWEDSKNQTKGKRIRPLILLLSTHAAGGDWHRAVPAAAAIELMHNFSLIHDDIQDKSLQRHGKDTIWVKWGEALAINAGDAMLTLSYLAVHRLSKDFSNEIVEQISTLLQKACLELTQGQFLDLFFEETESVNLDDYFKMIGGKTCSLLAAAMEIGALLGGATHEECELFRQCGYTVGEAYQVQDDWLGIWGNNILTGKSNESDLITRKKTYPVILGLEKKRQFYSLWTANKEFDLTFVPALTKTLIDDNVKSETEIKSAELYEKTFQYLDMTKSQKGAVEALGTLLKSLIKRDL
jgi:geranylgeranyl diphosphate synthase, type I